MSEEPEESYESQSDEDLAELLKKLEPTALNVDFLAELSRDHDRTVANASADPLRPHWRRVIPLTLVGCLVMAAYGMFQYGSLFNQTEAVVAEEKVDIRIPGEAGSSLDRFVPVSAQGYLVNTSSDGVVETEDGPKRVVTLDYEDAYHWHDPETGTNIRFFQPRNEEMIVPLEAD